MLMATLDGREPTPTSPICFENDVPEDTRVAALRTHRSNIIEFVPPWPPDLGEVGVLSPTSRILPMTDNGLVKDEPIEAPEDVNGLWHSFLGLGPAVGGIPTPDAMVSSSAPSPVSCSGIPSAFIFPAPGLQGLRAFCFSGVQTAASSFSSPLVD